MLGWAFPPSAPVILLVIWVLDTQLLLQQVAKQLGNMTPSGVSWESQHRNTQQVTHDSHKGHLCNLASWVVFFPP